MFSVENRVTKNGIKGASQTKNKALAVVDGFMARKFVMHSLFGLWLKMVYKTCRLKLQRDNC